MGYVVYWNEAAPPGIIPPAALAIIGPLLSEAYAAGLIQRDDNDPSPPELGPGRVRFNGVWSHDTFLYSPDSPAVRGWPAAEDFCKTNRKPYDAIVKRVLLVLTAHSPSMTVTSDRGIHGEEWREAREWAAAQGLAIHYGRRAIVHASRAGSMEGFRARVEAREAEFD